MDNINSNTTTNTTLNTTLPPVKIKNFNEVISTYGTKIVTSIIIFIIFSTLANVFKKYYSEKFINNYVYVEGEQLKVEIGNRSSTNIAFQQLQHIIYYSIMGFGVFTALVNLGVQPNTLLAIFGIFVVGIGLSLQTTINNIWAGLYISFNRLYSIGDLIEVNKVKGYVQSFSLFNTIIIDYDKKVPVVIPNTQIQTNVIMNYSVNQIYN